jgi:SAM-dependent methyltransferase
MATITATYSCDDNKIRLRASARLEPELYARVKAAGFAWAPKQDLFVAPKWTPEREDLAIELAGELGDEDTSLVERAEERAERFEGYSERRGAEAESAQRAASTIAQRFEGGQPILVGHHSERRARRDAEKIENNMRRSLRLWETSSYWTSRAAGALRHAKYKELPIVRARRIKTIETDRRSAERSKDQADALIRAWRADGLTAERGAKIAWAAHMYDLAREIESGAKTAEVARDERIPVLERWAARSQRWIEHCDHRVAYERAMLGEQGGLAAEKFNLEIGGQVFRRRAWFVITRINRQNGAVSSVSVAGHFASTIAIEEITDYRAPAEGDAAKVKAATDKGPMCNYPGEGFKHMTADEWKRSRWSDFPTSMIHKATDAHAKHRTRATHAPGWATVAVFLTDAKRVDAPAPTNAAPVTLPASAAPPVPPAPRAAPAPDVARERAAELRQTLKAGIKVVSAPQLFPTPPELAARMVREAEIQPGDRVLEPSAGTGSLLRAIVDYERILDRAGPAAHVVAVEVSQTLAFALPKHLASHVAAVDFLSLPLNDPTLGEFDRIVMNPPFENATDINHIRHAWQFLKPGGRLVALCADGPRQRETLKPWAEELGGTYESLPPDTFKSQGTGVRVALLVVDAPTAAAESEVA